MARFGRSHNDGYTKKASGDLVKGLQREKSQGWSDSQAGILAGQIAVPDDFDRMGAATSRNYSRA